MISRVARYWLPVIVMLAAMYYFSTDLFSGENTRSIVETILGWLVADPTPRMISRANYLTRKAAHFIEYAVLAALLFRAFRADSALRWRLRWAAASMCIAVAWAFLDEYHQAFTIRRGGSVHDALLDASGGLFALIVIAIVNRRSGAKDDG